MPSAAETFAVWLARCGTPIGGKNVLRVGGRLYVLQVTPERLQNGGLRGRAYVHNGRGFEDIGAYHIGRRGEVLRCPAVLLATLSGAPAVHIRKRARNA